VSPQGGRKASGRGRGNAPRPAATRRLGLLLFGVTFLVLFVAVAISEGLGDPSIPSGDVILVEDVPGDSGHVSKEKFDHELELAAKQAGLKKAPKPDSPKYEEVTEAAMTSLLETIWLEGQAAEMGITVSDAEIAKELEKLKKESFQSEAEFNAVVKESGFTPEDVDSRVKAQTLSSAVQQQLNEEKPVPTQREIENYYEAGKGTQFTQKASRDIRLINNKDREKVQQALALLEKDNTAKGWNKVAKKYSADPASNKKGGLTSTVSEGFYEEPLNEAVFESPEGQLVGPVKTPQNGYYVVEVQKSTPETVQDLKNVEGQIESQLSQEAEQENFNTFVSSFNVRWLSRTFCAEGYVNERCANFEGSGRPPNAPPACYEEDPDGGRPEACPAPVFQLIPALPGTVSPLAPKGTPLAQRPTPGAASSEAEAPAEGPGGAVPPPAEAPPSE
jgi:parvulin-like peptidyl-prolyl isomerase